MKNRFSDIIEKGKNRIKEGFNWIKNTVIDIAKTIKNVIIKEACAKAVKDVIIKKEDVVSEDISNEELKEIIVKKIVKFVFTFITKIFTSVIEFFTSSENQNKVIDSILHYQ